MKVIALVSGGKDSCYAALLAKRYGHELVALGNLLPVQEHVDELDSYMFQTVCHQLVEAYAACTGLPLLRKHIRGGSREQALAYSCTEGDEVEDLYDLLSYAKECYPELQAVSTGAIASDYQRLRVENVCARLGLVSLAYLWHQPQAVLLRDMIENKLDAILVKVAALGLDPHKHLGKSIAVLEPHLLSLRDRFGCNVCGEGGEYETLTLDCPLFVYGHIVLDDWEVILHSPGSVAPVGVLHPKSFHVEPRGEALAPAEARVIQVPSDYLPSEPMSRPWAPPARFSCEHQDMPSLHVDATTSLWDSPGMALVSCQAWAGTEVECKCESVTQLAMVRALEAVGAALELGGMRWEGAVMVHLYLRNMGHFAAANRSYCDFFPAVNPPARATVQAPLCSRWVLAISVLLAKDHAPLDRRTLHVQSISSWAPSNIGPYSQASVYGGAVLMAGSIPLDPPTMTLVPGGLADQVRRALVSSQAVAVALRSSTKVAALGWTIYLAEAAGEAAQEEVAGVMLEFMQGGATKPQLEDGEEEVEEKLDEYLCPPIVKEPIREPAMLYLTLPALPRGSLVEVEPLAVRPAQAAVGAVRTDSGKDNDVQPVVPWLNGTHVANGKCTINDTNHANGDGDGAPHEGEVPQSNGTGAPAAAPDAAVRAAGAEDTGTSGRLPGVKLVPGGLLSVRLPFEGGALVATVVAAQGRVSRVLVAAGPECACTPAATLCQMVVSAAQEALAAAGSSWGGVCSAAVYYVESPCLHQDDLSTELHHALVGAGVDTGSFPLLLPMLRVGVDGMTDCALAMDLLIIAA